MVTPSVRGWVHHYIFMDYYLRDERTALMESEMRYLEKQHGPMIVHWTTPLMLGDDMIVIDEDSSEGGKV